MLGYDPERIEVLLYQLVHLLKAGELAKMSKRAGDIVTLDELIDEVGVDAARWYLVSRSHDHRVLESGDAQGFRLGLCRATQTVVTRALDLIGVEAPERM